MPVPPIRNLTPAGAEPHDLELTPGDVRAVDDAALVLYLGEGFMPGLETAVEQRDGRSLDLLAGEDLKQGKDEDGEIVRDPHVWLDPVRYAAMARAIGVELGQPEAAERLAGKLEQLDAEFRRGLASCTRRQIVTSHAAFGYLASRYGLEQVPLEGLSPEAEPSARGIADLVDLVKTSGVTTVFFETLVSPKLAQTVAREAGVETAVLNPLEGLTDDETAAGEDYFSVMRSNLAALQKALGCRGVTPVVELEGVSFGYRAGVRVLDDVSLRVDAGEFVAIAGPNGGGKTTLLRLVLGLERATTGTVKVFGRAGGKGVDGARIGYLPQRARLIGEAPVTVREVVSTGRLAPAGIWGPLRRADREAVARAIETVGLSDRADSPLKTLSGGMQQRALIAKALASEPTLLALDEPTTGVDAESQESLGVLLEGLRERLGVTILYVSHEFGAVEHVVDRIVLVRGGIVYDGPPSGLPGVWHDPSHTHA